MDTTTSKQHVQLPKKMGEDGLTPADQLIYLSIKRYMNNKTMIAFPSLAEISRVSGAAINTIRKAIKRLEEKDYFKIQKRGRGQEYVFNKIKAFDPFSYDFLDKEDLTFTQKSYIAATQQYMYTDMEGYGKVSMTNRELAKEINMPESTISKTNRELVKKNYLTIIKNECRDIEIGCKKDTKLFHLTELEQAIIWTLRTHEDRINNHEDQIQQLTQRLNQMEKENRILMNRLSTKVESETEIII